MVLGEEFQGIYFLLFKHSIFGSLPLFSLASHLSDMIS